MKFSWQYTLLNKPFRPFSFVESLQKNADVIAIAKSLNRFSVETQKSCSSQVSIVSECNTYSHCIDGEISEKLQIDFQVHNIVHLTSQFQRYVGWITERGGSTFARFWRQEFREFPRPALTVGSYSSGPPAGRTLQILVFKTLLMTSRPAPLCTLA